MAKLTRYSVTKNLWFNYPQCKCRSHSHIELEVRLNLACQSDQQEYRCIVKKVYMFSFYLSVFVFRWWDDIQNVRRDHVRFTSRGAYIVIVLRCWSVLEILFRWAQVEWWLEHRHGWLIKHQWAGSVLGRVTRNEYQVLGSTSIPARLDTLVYWKSFSWLTSVGTTRNTVIRLGWSTIGLAVLIRHAAGAGLIGRLAVISGRYNKCHSLQLQNHYAHFPPLQHTHIHAKHSYAELVMGNDHGFRGIVCWPWQEESCVIG